MRKPQAFTPAPATNSEGQTLAAAMEAAMSKAVTDSLAAGVSDPEKQREAMRVARDAAKAEFVVAPEPVSIDHPQAVPVEPDADSPHQAVYAANAARRGKKAH